MKIFIAILVLVFGVVVCWFSFFYASKISTLANRVEVKVNNQTIIADVAKTDEDRTRGLGGRTNLGVNEGILFLFPGSGSYGFWMKDMKIPIDIVWISGNTVVGFEANVQPPENISVEDSNLSLYFPPVSIDRVLELQAGRAATLKLRQGDTITVRPLLLNSHALEL